VASRTRLRRESGPSPASGDSGAKRRDEGARVAKRAFDPGFGAEKKKAKARAARCARALIRLRHLLPQAGEGLSIKCGCGLSGAPLPASDAMIEAQRND
jgi:hypothetical protein